MLEYNTYMNTPQTISTRVPPDLLKALDRVRGETPRSQIIVRAIEDYLRKQKIQQVCRWLEKNAQRDHELAEELMNLEESDE